MTAATDRPSASIHTGFTSSPTTQGHGLMTLPEVLALTSCTKDAFKALREQPDFPRPFEMVPGNRTSLRWVAAEVYAWIARRMDSRDAPPAARSAEADPDPAGLLTLGDVCARMRVGRNKCWEIRRADSTFPSPVFIGSMARFRAEEFERWFRDWLDQLPREREPAA